MSIFSNGINYRAETVIQQRNLGNYDEFLYNISTIFENLNYEKFKVKLET